jgi:fluoride exporter
VTWLLVGVAGAAGAVTRYGIGVLAGPRGLLATLGINVTGSFLLGLLLTLAAAGRVAPVAAVALGTGYLGAFTTFSTFSVDVVDLVRDGRWQLATGYVAGSVLLGITAAALGCRAGVALRG